MKTNVLIFAALFLISNGIMAQRSFFAPGGDETGVGIWEDPDNWTEGLPGSTTDGRAIFKGGECFVDSDVSGTFRVELGDERDNLGSILTIENGGIVGAHRIGGGHSEVGIWSPATLIIEEGGVMSTLGHFWLGATKSYSVGADAQMGSEVHINGGTLIVGEMFGIDFYNDKEFSGGTLFMNGGLLDLAQWNPGNPDDPSANASIGRHGKIEYTAGLIKIQGNHAASLERFRDNDQITGDFEIWIEEFIDMIDDGEGGQIADTTYVTKLSNEGPVDEGTTVVDIILESTDHTTLASAVAAADLVGTLQGDGPFTVFAPTDAAFDLLPDGLLDGLSVEELTDILLYHVVGALAMSTDLADGQEITTLLGQDVVVTLTDGTVKINDAEVTIADLEADNGVVHVIDVVLVPEADDVAVGDISLHDINIYPNPATSKLYISHTVKIDRVEIYNITGSRVLSQDNVTTEAIDISELNSGLYFISVIDVNNNNIVRKIIKQ